jgi:hypothetical protein
MSRLSDRSGERYILLFCIIGNFRIPCLKGDLLFLSTRKSIPHSQRRQIPTHSRMLRLATRSMQRGIALQQTRRCMVTKFSKVRVPPLARPFLPSPLCAERASAAPVCQEA